MAVSLTGEPSTPTTTDPSTGELALPTRISPSASSLAAILVAFPDKPLTEDKPLTVARDLQPTPEFREIGT